MKTGPPMPRSTALTKPNHPWTKGQVERMNRKIKDATVKRFHHDSHALFAEVLAA
jgi:hypothetical protein